MSAQAQPETYTCARCHREFSSDWSNEESLAEKDRIFGDLPIEQCDVICDDCFQFITTGPNADVFEHFNTFHNPSMRGSETCDLVDCAWRQEEQALASLSPEARYVMGSYLRLKFGLS